jgi:hypothetical protein
MSRLKTLRRLARVILPAVAVSFVSISNAAHVASGGTPYLTTVGPPSLRFAPSPDRGVITPTYYSLADSQPKKPEVAVAAPGVKPVITPPAQPVVAPEPSRADDLSEIAVFPPSTNGTMITSSSPPAALPFTPPPDIGGAIDNTVVTPEMLLDYLKPSPVGTGNAAQTAVVVPVKLGFVPPTPATAPSSQAVYKKE